MILIATAEKKNKKLTKQLKQNVYIWKLEVKPKWLLHFFELSIFFLSVISNQAWRKKKEVLLHAFTNNRNKKEKQSFHNVRCWHPVTRLSISCRCTRSTSGSCTANVNPCVKTKRKRNPPAQLYHWLTLVALRKEKTTLEDCASDLASNNQNDVCVSVCVWRCWKELRC